MGEQYRPRIWGPVYNAYRKTAYEGGIILSDLITTVLIESAFDKPKIVYTLITWFGLKPKEAERIADILSEEMKKAVEEITTASKEQEARGKIHA